MVGVLDPVKAGLVKCPNRLEEKRVSTGTWCGGVEWVGKRGILYWGGGMTRE